MIRFGLLILILLASGSTQASVIYNWESLAGTEDFTVAEGQLIITDSAYRKGSLSGYYRMYEANSPDWRYPNSSILKAQLGISGRDGRVINELIAFPRRPAGTNPPIYELDIGIKITPNGLGGGLYMTTYESNVLIAADDAGIWTASGYSSDNPPTLECFYIGNNCSGATGRWVLDEDSISVPEPGSMLLLGLACIATFTTWRLKTA